MVSAWEEGLEGVEDAVVSLTLAAAQLRRLVSSLVMSRNSLRETREMSAALNSVEKMNYFQDRKVEEA